LVERKGMELIHLGIKFPPNWVGLDPPHFTEVSSSNIILIKKFQASLSIHSRRKRKIHIHRPPWSQALLAAAGISPVIITTSLYTERGGMETTSLATNISSEKEKRGGEIDLEEQEAVDKEI